jgi:hypothetical protein
LRLDVVVVVLFHRVVQVGEHNRSDYRQSVQTLQISTINCLAYLILAFSSANYVISFVGPSVVAPTEQHNVSFDLGRCSGPQLCLALESGRCHRREEDEDVVIQRFNDEIRHISRKHRHLYVCHHIFDFAAGKFGDQQRICMHSQEQVRTGP